MQSKHGQAQRERVRAECFEGGLNHLCGPVLPGFPWPHHLALSALESTFGLTKDPPLCAYASFSQDGFQCKGFWEVDRTYYDLMLPPLKILSVHCVTWWGVGRRVSLTQEWEICGLFIFYPTKTQILLAPAMIFILKDLSTGDRFQLLSLAPIYPLPQRFSSLREQRDQSSLIPASKTFL